MRWALYWGNHLLQILLKAQLNAIIVDLHLKMLIRPHWLKCNVFSHKWFSTVPFQKAIKTIIIILIYYLFKLLFSQITVSQVVPQNASQFFSAPQSQSVVNPPLQPQSTMLPGLHPQLGPQTQPGLQPQSGLLSQPSLQLQPGLQPQPGPQPQTSLQPQPVQSAVMNSQFVSGVMQGQIPNSQLFVQPQPNQQPMHIKPQTMTPSKPLVASGKSSSGVLAEGTPLHQVSYW